MWPKRRKIKESLKTGLVKYSTTVRPLRGIEDPAALETLAMQMVASLRRLDYTKILRSRSMSAERTEPNTPMFDPERAAIFYANIGNIDEAFWLTFLSIHFGKHSKHGWQLLRDIYSGLGKRTWTWQEVVSNPGEFRNWLRQNRHLVRGSFGNHRKYETLDADSEKGTAAVVESYIDWIGPKKSHADFLGRSVKEAGNDPHKIFDFFYKSMNVSRFGRLGKFDFLSLVGRLGLAPIAPGSAYLRGATGPLSGARLLFTGDPKKEIIEATLEDWLRELDAILGIGMQAMEDSLCNWQKSPTRFIHFRG